MGKKWIAQLGFVLALGVSVHACRSRDTIADSAGNGASARAAPLCVPGHLGCPCPSDGAVIDCGTTVARHGDYVTCAMGRSTCQSGRWGACSGDTLVTKSVRGATLGASGLRTLSTTIQCPSTTDASDCSDICDPNVYTVTTGGPGDVDAAESGIAILDGGLTLEGSCPEGGCSTCPDGGSTTLVGTVYDPAGVNPVYNAYVYVPTDPSGQLMPFSSGASCGACAPTIDALTVTQTGPDGTFVLTNVPSTDVTPGNPVPLVVQLAKWRREVMLTQVPMCQTTKVDPGSSRLPRNQLDGFGGHADIPKMAIASGSDPIECLLLKMGVDVNEFQLPGTGMGRIDYYVATGGANFGTTGGTPSLSTLTGSVGTLTNYDIVMLPCEGYEDTVSERFADNVSAYANAGGRLFTSHYGYTWLATPLGNTAYQTNPSTNNTNPFYDVASWALNSRAGTAVNATIPVTLPGGQPFPKGQAFKTWAQTVGASPSPAQIPLGRALGDVSSVIAPTVSWIVDPAVAAYPYLFSFDTPIGGGGSADGGGSSDSGAGACGRVDFSEFHVPAANRIGPPPASPCNSDSDCGFTAKCLPMTVGTCAPLPCTSNSDCTAGNTCVSGTPGTCAPQACTLDTDCLSLLCVQGVQGTCGCTQESQCASDSCVAGRCAGQPQACTADFQCGSVERCSGAVPASCQMTCLTNADCTQGQLCTSGLCQGCNGPTNCPSKVCNGVLPSRCSAAADTFPLECKQGPLSPEEDALEFTLLDLSACISPDALPPPIPLASGSGAAASGSVALIYQSATFTEDFTSSCPQGTRAVWRTLDWQASIPDTASIDFSAQTDVIPADGGSPQYSAMPVLLGTATATTACTCGFCPGPSGGDAGTDAGVDAGSDAGSTCTPPAYIDTGTTGAFNMANPPIISRDALRLTVTLYPTSDGRAAPTLMGWQVKADCLPSE